MTAPDVLLTDALLPDPREFSTWEEYADVLNAQLQFAESQKGAQTNTHEPIGLSGTYANLTNIHDIVKQLREDIEINVLTKTADFTFALTDAHDVVKTNSASQITGTIPLNSSVAFDVGTIIGLNRVTAGAFLVQATSGVTLNGIDGGMAFIEDQYKGAALIKIATDEWLLQGALSDVGVSTQPVDFVTTANVALASGGIANGTTHDGQTATTGQRVGVFAQTDASENGIYIVPASGAASRATDFDGDEDLYEGIMTFVKTGTEFAGSLWV